MVVMADGNNKVIGQVRVGDKVTATDPVTGETGPRTVTALITGEGEKNLVEITVTSPGGHPGKVVATDNHPFWAPEPGKWLYAKEIVPGMLLQTGNGSYTQVSAVRAWTQHKRVHNLTVDDLHTYYVLAGSTPLLVHNCGPGMAKGDACTCPADQPFSRFPTNAESTGRLAGQAQAAEANGFGHGVSVRPGVLPGASVATKEQLEEAGMSLTYTPTRNIPDHHTLILPQPVDATVRKTFNTTFGR